MGKHKTWKCVFHIALDVTKINIVKLVLPRDYSLKKNPKGWGVGNAMTEIKNSKMGEIPNDERKESNRIKQMAMGGEKQRGKKWLG